MLMFRSTGLLSEDGPANLHFVSSGQKGGLHFADNTVNFEKGRKPSVKRVCLR